MKKERLLEIMGIGDLMELPSAMMSLVMSGDADYRKEKYRELLLANGGDVSHDWFQEIYEAEMSERKQKKQDFTPRSLSELCAELAGNTSNVHEPTAGNGAMVIAAWDRWRSRLLPWQARPSRYVVTCWELSDRSIPLLLFNLSVRGMMAYVYHGDVLEKSVKQKYIVLNREDDALAFSEVVAVGNGARIESEEGGESL